MRQSRTNHHNADEKFILKKPIQGKSTKGRNIMHYPIETTTWNTEIHSMAHQRKWKRLAEKERMLRIAKKNKKQSKPDVKRVLEAMHIFLTLAY